MIIKESDAVALKNFKINEVSDILQILKDKNISMKDSMDWLYEINDAKEFGISTFDILNKLKTCESPDELAEWVYRNTPSDKYKAKYNESILKEKFSRNIPDWVIKHINTRYNPIKDKLSRNIDLNNAEWEPIDKNNITTKDISNDDPDKIRIFRLDFAHDNKFIYTYIPGYEDGGYAYLPRDGKYHYISKMAKKDIINAIVDGGVLTCDSEALSKKRQDRADAKKGSINRGSGQYQGYDYAKDPNGYTDFSTKIYNNKWYNSRGQDKSGYEQVDYLKTLARKLTKMDKDNYKIIMNKMKTSIDEAKDLFIQLLKTSPEKLAYGTTNRDRWDSSWMRVAYDTNSTLKDLIKQYEDIDKTIKRSEEKGNIEDTISYLNDGYYNLGEIRKNLGNLSMNLKSMIDELSKVDESLTEKKEKKINSDFIYNELEKIGYHNIFANRSGDGYYISKRFENNLKKAKDVLDKYGIEYTVKPSQDRFYLDMHFTPEQIAEEKERCVICGKIIDNHGNNAEPVKHGKCCDKCNMSVVIPERMKAVKKLDKYKEFQLYGTQDLDD